jgi:uncharacterized protein
MNNQIEKKYRNLESILREMTSIVVGFSGGVDSTLLLKVAYDTLGTNVLAVIGKSATYPSAEYREAISLAESIGVRYLEVQTEETDILKFKENPVDRCYYCKTELFGKLTEIALQKQIPWITDGTILDDMGDFRPGMRAKNEKNVRSPLLEAGFTKEDVRELSRDLNLSTWDKPSFACLSSRFPYGMAITQENLSKVDRAESFLRENGFRRFRVRHHDERIARIEFDPDEFDRLFDRTVRTSIIEYLKSIGYTYITVDLQGYRTGSMNEVIPMDIQLSYMEKK